MEPAETAGGGEGDPPKDVPAAVAVPDYGPAFEHLVRLGLPDATGATYVKLTLHGDAGREAEMMMSRRYSGMGAKLPAKGDAWLLPGPADGASTLIQGGYQTVTVVKKAQRSGLLRLLIGPAKQAAEDGVQGDWTNEDVAADAQKIIETLRTQSGEDRVFAADRWSYDEDGPTWCADVLVAACHMYRAGHRDEANQITDLLLGLAPEPIVVVDQVVHTLAERNYQELVKAFFESGDWKTYHEETRKLVARFTRGWRSREGAELLLARLDKQLNGAKASLTPLEGVVVKPEAAAIMDQWLTSREPVTINAPTCWLLGADLPASADDDEFGVAPPAGEEETERSRVGEICAMGMDGFIALTTAATDETLIPTTMEDRSSGGFDGHFSSRYSGDGDADPGAAQYRRMSRPCSRGEIARAVILRSLPDPGNELSTATPAELQAAAHQWWLAHRNDSKTQLTRHYLEAGSSQQSEVAMMALIQSEDEEDAMLVEKHILEAEDLTDQFSLVDRYLSAKRGKARPFFETYSKALRELVGDGTDEDNTFNTWRLEEAGGVEKYLKRLSVYVDDITPGKILADLRDGTLGFEEGFPMLRTASSGKPIAEHLPALVAVARRQETPAEQYAVLEELRGLVYRDQEEMDSQEEMEAYRKTLPGLLAASKDDWTHFLGQDSPPAEPGDYDSAPTLAAAAAAIIETIYFPENGESLGELGQVMSSAELWAFVLDHARKLVNGEDAPAFPSAETVDEERRQAIRDTLKPMTSEEILKHYEALPLHEKLAWSDILDEFGEEPPAGVAELSKRVAKIHWPPAREGDEAWRKEFAARTEGKILDAAVVEGVIQLMLDQAPHFQDLVIYLQSGGQGSHGIILTVVPSDDGTEWSDRILASGHPLLTDGKAKKVVGLYAPSGPEGDSLIGLRFEPAQPDAEAASPVKAATAHIVSMLGEGRRFYALLAAETADHLKQREAEQENDPELDAIPGL